MIWLIVVAVIWIIGGFVTYNCVIKDWDNTKFEKVWFSCVWPVLLPLFVIHWLHMHL